MKPSEMLPVDLNAYIITKEPQGQHGDHGAQHNKKQTAFVKSQTGWKKIIDYSWKIQMQNFI